MIFLNGFASVALVMMFFEWVCFGDDFFEWVCSGGSGDDVF